MPPCKPPIERPWPVSGVDESQTFTSDDERQLYRADKKREKRLRCWTARDEWRRRLVEPGAWLFVIAATLLVVLLGLQTANIPDHWWGQQDKHKTLDYVVAVAGALGGVLSAVLAAAYARLRHARYVDRRLEELAKSIARQVRDMARISTDHISVHIWQVRDPRVWGIPHWVPKRPHARHLSRRAAFITERREHESFAFMKGVGVIGRCWERRREIVEDLSHVLAVADDAKTYYDTLNYRQRYRLSYAALWNTRHFWAIWAYPLFLGPPGARPFGGVVSVDIQCPGHADALRKVADNRTQELDSLLADCAALLRDDTPPH
jgi:hypothetical protein